MQGKVGKVCPDHNWASQKAHQADAHLQFPQYEATRSISTPPGWDTSPSQVTSQHFVRLLPKKFADSHLYTWVKRSTVRVKCFA